MNTAVRKRMDRTVLGILVLGAVLAAVVILAPGQGLAAPASQPHMAAAKAAPCELLCQLPTTSPGILYVDWEAAGANDGSSWEDAFVDLQLALDVALPGDEIWVAAGTYYPSEEHGGSGDRFKSFQMLNGVGIYGGFDPSTGDVGWEDRDWVANPTTLSGDIGVPGHSWDNSFHVFYHPDELAIDDTAVLDGFRIVGGNAVGGSHTLGGGMNNYGASPSLANCTFEANAAENGGAMSNYFSSSPTLANCTMCANAANQNGGGIYNAGGSEPVLVNCTLAANQAGGSGGAIYNEDSSATVTNSSFHGNSAGSSGGGVYSESDGSPTITNCIFWGNAPDEVIGGSPAVTHSDIQDGYPGEGNIDADPLWVDPGAGDFHLQPCSPAIDAGDNTAPELPPTDFDGDDRIFNGTVDMGADETDFYPPATYELTVSSTDGGSVVEPGEGIFTYECGRYVTLAALADTGFRFLSWTGDEVADPASANTAIVVDTDRAVVANFGLITPVIYVDADATGGNDGTSWDDAYTSLQSALDVATPNVDVWVAEGTYLPCVPHGGTDNRFRSFQMLNGVRIYGGFDPSVGDTDWEDRDWVANETILSGDIGVPGEPSDNAFHVFYHPEGLDLDETAILDGFTITSAKADGPDHHLTGGGMYNHGSSPSVASCSFEGNEVGGDNPYASGAGGGVYNDASSPRFTGCSFLHNTAVDISGYGAGMYNYSSSPELVNCTFEGNSARNGGGMRNYLSSPVLTSCVFSGNSATNYGGGMNNLQAYPLLINCLFAENSAFYGGGLYNSASSPALTNCTFANNEAYNTGGIYNYQGSLSLLTNCILWGNEGEISGSAIVTYSDVQDGYDGEGNIDEDPLFLSGFHLSLGSPCIDAGTNDAPYLPPTDIEGDDRILDGDGDGLAVVDMGADEVWATRLYLPLVLRNQ